MRFRYVEAFFFARLPTLCLHKKLHQPKSAASGVKKSNKIRVLDGGQGRDRTADTRIFSPLLYQLSYLAVCAYCVPLSALRHHAGKRPFYHDLRARPHWMSHPAHVDHLILLIWSCLGGCLTIMEVHDEASNWSVFLAQ